MCIFCRKAKSPLKAKNGSPPASESPSKPVAKKKGGRLMIESDDEEENTSMEVEIISKEKVSMIEHKKCS